MRIGIALLVLAGAVAPAWAQSGENVAVVINENSAASRAIGEYYAAQRDIPASNIFRIRAPLDEEIDRTTFTSAIEWPLRNLISMRGLQDRVLYIVLTKDVPLRVAGSHDQFWTAASVDSELTLLYRRMVGRHIPLVGHVENPYFLKAGEPGAATPFSHRDHDIVLVSRLDGYSVDDVLALIDRSTAAASLNRGPRSHTHAAAHARTQPATGAILASLPPSDASTFRTARSGENREPSVLTRGSARVAVADLTRQGLVGASGETNRHVPRNPVDTTVLAEAYFGGASVVEAFYRSTPFLSAGTIVVGDPLCAPFRQTALTRADLEAADDPDTALPGLFAERRLREMLDALPYIARPAVALNLRAKVYSDRGDVDGAQELLEQATAMAPDFATAQFHLGTLYQARGDYDLAVDRYRRAIDAQPPMARDELGGILGSTGTVPVRAAALNNLAYVLAVHQLKPADALPYAARAVTQAPGEPSLMDTLAWIEHLLGDTAGALTHIRAALAAKVTSATILLHAAEIFAAAGAHAEARTYLKAALRLRPDLDGSAEVARIQTQFGPDDSPATLPALR